MSTLSKQYSSRGLPSHTKLKYHQDAQIANEVVITEDLKRQLDGKEAQAPSSNSRNGREIGMRALFTTSARTSELNLLFIIFRLKIDRIYNTSDQK